MEQTNVLNDNAKEEFYIRNSKTINRNQKLKFELWKIVYQYLFRPSPKCLKIWRTFLLRAFGAKIAAKCYVSPYAFIQRPWQFEMGYYSSVDDFCYLITPIKIGDFCAVGNNCHLIAGGHDIWSRGFESVAKPITIGNGVFLGCGCYVAQGISIGQMSVVGAHINVLKNIPENTVVAQIPTKTINVHRIPVEEYSKYKYHH